MRVECLFLIWLYAVLNTFSAFAQEQDSPTIIWSEDFKGCYEMPVIGKYANYRGSKTQLKITDYANGVAPEVSLGNDEVFKVAITLYGASGDFTLKFKSNSRVEVYKDNSEQSLLGTVITPNNDKSYSIHVEDGSNYLYLHFEKAERTNAYIDDIVLTAPSTCRKSRVSPNLSFNSSEYTATLGGDNHFPKLANEKLHRVYYWSTDTSVAKISEDTGEILLRDVGETTISAVYHGGDGKDDNFVANKDTAFQEVSYKLKVVRKVPDGEIFYESFNNTLFKGGHTEGDDKDFRQYGSDILILKDAANNPSLSDSLGCAYKCIYVGIKPSRVNYNGSYAVGLLATAQGKKTTLSLRIAGAGDKVDSDSTEIAIVKNGKKTIIKNLPLLKSKWAAYSVALPGFDENSVLTISGKRFYLDDVSLVAKDSTQVEDNTIKIDDDKVRVSISKYGYATLYFSDKALRVPSHMKAYTINVVGSVAYVNKTYNSGDVIPKGEAVILQADEGYYNMLIVNEDIAKDEGNQLCGSDTAAETTGGSIYYLFGVNTTTSIVGFYWGAENGAAFVSNAHRAFLPLGDSELEQGTNAAKVLPLSISNNNTSTSIDALRSRQSKSSPSYSLSGIPVSSNYHGIIVRGGRKFVNR